MRQKRAKAYKKQMLVYNHTFKFREPYQVLVDDQIVLETNKSSFDLLKGLKRTLQAEVKPMITQCCMQKLYDTKNQDAIAQGKLYERRRCNHVKEPKEPIECLQSVVAVNGQNRHRYIVASQDIAIRRALRKVPGVPLVYINRAVMVMEPLSSTSEQVSREAEKQKLFKGLNDPKYTGIAENSAPAGAQPAEGAPTLKRKGPKAPNPLSMKKRKVKEEQPTSDASEQKADASKKRRRKHKKATSAETPAESTSD
ncbi:ACR011Cp [Eremothecium gossypii ATCC 10895]|uniref:U three protein 23 n=2 Tax=Eremothecium gossypii TaxID=33169 RepID=Q75CA1_EREGS|nr:ACR011Cp [Eremothecium gossypii ATCC 10895]AAS51238.1 ACR011Cp [Eremothecium gossypii ATCC 10895]AEY95529.1 FACR011Cp [Eremothecium gossypii FDAG1]